MKWKSPSAEPPGPRRIPRPQTASDQHLLLGEELRPGRVLGDRSAGKPVGLGHRNLGGKCWPLKEKGHSVLRNSKLPNFKTPKADTALFKTFILTEGLSMRTRFVVVFSTLLTAALAGCGAPEAEFAWNERTEDLLPKARKAVRMRCRTTSARPRRWKAGSGCRSPSAVRRASITGTTSDEDSNDLITELTINFTSPRHAGQIRPQPRRPIDRR